LLHSKEFPDCYHPFLLIVMGSYIFCCVCTYIVPNFAVPVMYWSFCAACGQLDLKSSNDKSKQLRVRGSPSTGRVV
jgi:hypothetical protein